MQHNKIYKVSAGCGSAKTYSAMNEAVRLANQGERVLVVQPTIQCIEEWEPFVKERVSTFKFHGEQNPGIVAKSFNDHLRTADKRSGEIVFVTHALLRLIPFFIHKHTWTVIHDEIPAMTKTFSLNLKNHRDELNDYFKQSHTPEGIAIHSTDETFLRDIIEGSEHDDVDKVFEPLARALLDDFSITYMLEENQSGIFNFLSVLQPSFLCGFKRAIVMGANFDDSLMPKLWNTTSFVDYEPVTSRLRFQKHENGHRLTIHYMFDRASKTRLEQMSKETPSKTNHQLLVDWANANFNDGFLYVDNNIRNPKTNGVRLPAIAHGLNAYSDVHQVAIFGTYLANGFERRLMQGLGISGDELTKARQMEMFYQDAMRCSLRDPNATEPVDIFVPDHASALRIQELFAGSQIKCIATSEEQLSYRKRKKKELIESLIPSSNRLGTILYKDSIGNHAIRFPVTFCEGIYDKQQKQITYELNDFIEQLQYLSNTTKPARKSDNILVCPSTFKDTTNRKRSNVDFSWHLWVDVEGGVMTESEFAKLMHPFRVITFNTASSTDKTRFRAFIPTQTQMNGETYHLMMEWVRNKCRLNGFVDDKTHEKFHGIDESKLQPENLMYLPAHPCVKDGISFFEDRHTDILNPIDVIDELNIPVPTTTAHQPMKQINVINASVDDIFAEYQSVPANTGQRHNAFFKACRKLRLKGYDGSELYQLMTQMDYDGSRKDNYASITQSLPSYI